MTSLLVDRHVWGRKEEVSRAWPVALATFRPVLGFGYVDLFPSADEPGWAPHCW